MKSESITATAAEIKAILDERDCSTAMTALSFVTAQMIASFGLLPDKALDDAIELFTKQVRAIYAELVPA